MSDRPVIITLPSGARYNTEQLNSNFVALRNLADSVLGVNGTSGANNTMTGDLDLDGNTLRNTVFDSAVIGMDWKGAWVTTTAYALNESVSNSGNSYICIIAHTSGTFATDLAALNWDLLAQKGDTGATGPGSGDLLSANNLSDVGTAATALTNIGGIGAATTDTLTNKTFDADGTGNSLSNVDIGNTIAASQAEAEAGTDNTKLVTSLRVAEAIAALGGSGGLAYIATVTASGAASADFSAQLSSTYNSYLVIGSNISPATDQTFLNIRTDSNGGASYDAGASDYAWSTIMQRTATVAAMESTGDTSVSLTGVGADNNRMGNAANETGFLTLRFDNPNQTTDYKFMQGHFSYINYTGGHCNSVFGGRRLATAAIDSFQILASSGNITGVFRLYGIVNS